MCLPQRPLGTHGHLTRTLSTPSWPWTVAPPGRATSEQEAAGLSPASSPQLCQAHGFGRVYNRGDRCSHQATGLSPPPQTGQASLKRTRLSGLTGALLLSCSGQQGRRPVPYLSVSLRSHRKPAGSSRNPANSFWELPEEPPNFHFFLLREISEGHSPPSLFVGELNPSPNLITHSLFFFLFVYLYLSSAKRRSKSRIVYHSDGEVSIFGCERPFLKPLPDS